MMEKEQHDYPALEGGYGKWWMRVRGEMVVLVLVIVAGFSGLFYLLDKHDREMRDAEARQERAMVESNEIQAAILWVNSIPEAEKAKLNLTRPKKIAEMQR